MATIRVPRDYPTLQEAIGAASPGDTIILTAGGGSADVTTTDLTIVLSTGINGARLNLQADNLTLAGSDSVSVFGGEGSNTIVGNSGANYIDDGDSEVGYADSIDGGVGNDTIVSNSGLDTLKGGDGNDLFIIRPDYGGVSGSIVSGGTGVDTVSAGALGSFVFSGVEILSSPNLSATVAQLRSFLQIGATSDPTGLVSIRLNGEGGTLDLTTKLRAHNLYLDAQSATSSIAVKGTKGSDTVIGSSSDDRIEGGNGNDDLTTSGGSDKVYAGDGDDILRITGAVGVSAGIVDGGAGTDKVVAANLGNHAFVRVEVLDAVNGHVIGTAAQLTSFSTIAREFGFAGPISVDLVGSGGSVDLSSSIAADRGAVVDAHLAASGVSVIGTGGLDTITGSSSSDILDGGAGADAFAASAGRDTLRGGEGGDVFVVRSGSGQIDGGADTDTIVSHNLGSYSLSSVEVLETSSVKASVDQLKSFQTITDGDAANNEIAIQLVGSGGALNLSKIVSGKDGILLDSTFVIGALNVTGSQNDDTIRGSDYDDRLSGGGGVDILIGGQGYDTYVTDGDDIIAKAANFGIDRVLSSGSFAIGQGQSIESLTLTGAADINGTGNELANTILGSAGANVLDRGLAADILRGFNGADAFQFSTKLSASNVDRIVDFVAGEDLIQLEDTIFTVLSPGALATGMFKDITSAGTPIDSNDFILYDRSTGALYYDADGSGSGREVQFAVLATKSDLTSADFLVV